MSYLTHLGARFGALLRLPGAYLQSLELDATQKVEIAAVVLVVGVCGYLNWRYWMARDIDLTVASWTEERRIRANTALPASKLNPEKKYNVTIFASTDGRLELSEPAEGGAMSVTFTPDNRKNDYVYYKDDASRIQGVKDPIRRSLTMAGYAAAAGRRPSLLADAQLNKDQWEAEYSARKSLQEKVRYLKDGTADGSFESGLYRKVMDTLKAYRDAPGDPAKDAEKGKLASKVMEAGLAYVTKLGEARHGAVQEYVDTVSAMLDAGQKENLAKSLARSAAPRRPTAKTG